MNLDRALNSKIHRKIIAFFHENQASVDTPRGIATWIREDRSRVREALEDLVQTGVLNAHRAPSTTGYGYTTDTKLIARIAKLLKRKAKNIPS
jgi:predicted transcriptional regulator